MNLIVWHKDWLNLTQEERTNLTDEELLEYMQWLACNEPKKYGELMMNVLFLQGRFNSELASA